MQNFTGREKACVNLALGVLFFSLPLIFPEIPRSAVVIIILFGATLTVAAAVRYLSTVFREIKPSEVEKKLNTKNYRVRSRPAV